MRDNKNYERQFRKYRRIRRTFKLLVVAWCTSACVQFVAYYYLFVENDNAYEAMFYAATVAMFLLLFVGFPVKWILDYGKCPRCNERFGGRKTPLGFECRNCCLLIAKSSTAQAPVGEQIPPEAELNRIKRERWCNRYRSIRRFYVVTVVLFWVSTLVITVERSVDFGDRFWNELFFSISIDLMLLTLLGAMVMKAAFRIWECPKCRERFDDKGMFSRLPHRCQHCGFAVTNSRNAHPRAEDRR